MGLDILDFFRGKYTWRKFLNLIEKLPWDSRYKLAHFEDEELAAQLLAEEEAAEDSGEEPQKRRIGYAEWDRTREFQANLLDRVALLERAVIATSMGGGKPPRFRPEERPESAVQRLRRKQREQRYNDFEARISGGRTT